MANMGHAMHPVHGASRGLNFARVKFDTNNTSDPDGKVDEAGVLATSGALAYSATGIITVTLRERWRKVDCYCAIVDTTTGSTIRVAAKVEGAAAANSVTLYQETAHVATATTDKEVDLLFVLSR